MRSFQILGCLLCCFGVLLASCDRPFRHPTKSPDQWRADHAACEQMVRESLRNTPDASDPMFEIRLINTCMEKKGWRKQ
ncbi:MAG: hypothetical protein QNJ22_21445 [Desulfosarcinaceae bacterium]|nr:hypothetical protein [Desulfosarcinaceae bacterium]